MDTDLKLLAPLLARLHYLFINIVSHSSSFIRIIDTYLLTSHSVFIAVQYYL